MSQVLFSSWGRKIYAPSTGAASAGPEAPELPTTFRDGRSLRAFMGWDGLIVCDEEVDVVDMARAYMDAAQKESCGQCTPCRLGTRVLLDILERICAGKGEEGDPDRLAETARWIKDLSMCDIGQTTPIPLLDSITHFRDRYTDAVRKQKPIPRGRYQYKVTAPCMDACPSHLDVPGYVERIRLGRFEEAVDVVRRDCNLPGTVGRVCVRPCEFNCRRRLLDEPIAIKPLKRFAADQELALGHEPEFPSIGMKEGKIAIVGAGPAGLACAYYLGLRGYRSTVFESLDEPGGMAAVGIPDYRLPRHILRREAEWVERVGAEIRYSVHVGKDVDLEDLMTQGYKAVFLASGAHGSSKMRCEGEDQGYEGFMPGVQFLREIAVGRKPLEGKRIVVIGGGNVAIDCVRSALRIGFEDVNLVYRRTESEMPADEVEIEDAREEHVRFHFLTQPIKILAEKGRVTGIECLQMELGEPDESGRRRPVPIEGSNFVLEADAVIPAIGQFCIFDFLSDDSGVELSRWSTLVIDRWTFETSRDVIFGGGDCATGPDTLIAALAAGKNAARYIAQYLESGRCTPGDEDYLEGYIHELGVYDPEEQMPIVGGQKRQRFQMLDAESRTDSFEEVEKSFTIPEALEEAARCLRCYRIGLAAL